MKINLISEWGNVVSNVRNNIVFEKRNQTYGAYFIRREYPCTMFFSLFVTVSVIVCGVLALKVSQYFAKQVVEFVIPDTDFRPDIVIPVNLKQIENPIEKVEPTKPSPAPKGIEFIAPVITDDKDSISDNQPAQDSIKPGRVDGIDNDSIIHIPEKPGKGTGVVKVDTAEKILDFVDVNPSFPGGIEKMYEFISNKLKYPQIEKDNGVSGTVYISFVVDKSGKIKDVAIERGITHGPNLAKEAQRVIGIMPDWQPGIFQGQTVAVRYRMPIKFVLK